MPDNSYSQTQQQLQALAQTLSPQQLLAVQLLEMTTVEIEERVRGEVMDNPALEAVEPDEAVVQGDGGGDLPEPYPAYADDDYSGNDDMVYLLMALGFEGVISVLSNVKPANPANADIVLDDDL